MRVFIAVDISEEIRQRVADRIKFFKSKFPDLRVGWDKPEKLHLTLKFLGEIKPENAEELISALQNVAIEFSPFQLSIAGAGAFPPRGAARVLWLGVKDESNKLAEINLRIEDECERLGFEREQRAFKPHLTIARLKEPGKSRALTEEHLATDFPSMSWRVEQLTVYQSKLLPGGSVYTALARQQFKM